MFPMVTGFMNYGQQTIRAARYIGQSFMITLSQANRLPVTIQYPYEKLSDYTKKLNDYMAEVDQKYVLILDDEAFYKKDLWDKYTCNSNIDALLYLNYDKNNAYDGKIIVSVKN